MPTQITNQASIAFNYGGSSGTALSNVAQTTLLDPLSAAKRSLEDTYRAGDTITYVLSVRNNGAAALTDVTVTDNLGAYNNGTQNVTPLTYGGKADLYINGVYSAPITGTPGGQGVEFTIATLAAGANALIVYTATVNEYAPLATDSTIVNTATFTATGIMTPVTDSNTITVAEYADLAIFKEMSPDPVSEDGTLTYTFTISNYGNTEATNVVLTDTFDPAPALVSVSVGDSPVSTGDYTYTSGTLTLPTGGSYSITVPAATFKQEASTGAVTTVPGTVTITVVGTI